MERHRSLKKMSITLERHSGEVRANQFMLLACSYKFYVPDVLHKRLHLRAYTIQMIHALTPSDQVAHINFTVDILERTDASPDILRQVCFLDEVTFHVNGAANRYNCRFWGSQNPYVTCELERGSPRVNVWAGLIHDKLI
jgi:hypothetical protein